MMITPVTRVVVMRVYDRNAVNIDKSNLCRITCTYKLMNTMITFNNHKYVRGLSEKFVDTYD